VRDTYNTEKGENSEIYREYKFSEDRNMPFEDLIFDSPEDLHEMITDEIFYESLKNLTDKQKQALYYNVACSISSAELPAILGTSERNIRKHKGSAIEKIRKAIDPVLRKHIAQELSVSMRERKFVERQDEPKMPRYWVPPTVFRNKERYLEYAADMGFLELAKQELEKIAV